MHSIVIYFSHFGNTGRFAEKTASLTGSDLVEIKPDREYPKDRDKLLDLLNDSDERSRRSVFQPIEVSMDNYGVVILAFPIWCENMPGEVRSFVESVDWRGRKVFPLVTYGGIRGTGVADMKKLCKGASFGPSCYMRTGYDEDSGVYAEDDKRYETWIRDIKGFLMR